MTRWGEIKCERCAENDALWEGMERALEESDAREARSRRWREDLERRLGMPDGLNVCSYVVQLQARQVQHEADIEALTAERDALREAVDEVTEYLKRHEAERDALAEHLCLTERTGR